MKCSKNAFTLIEVLISVIILATIATYLFQMSINSKTNYKKLNIKKEWENITTTLIQQKKQNSNTNLYEKLRRDYNITNFDLRNSLKKLKLKKDIVPYSKIKIPGAGEIYFNIEKINIYNKEYSTNLFSISMGNQYE